MKLPREVELLAISAVEDAVSGQAATTTEAPFMSAFRTWPGPPRAAARRLAAHANAARGRNVLWIIGLDPARTGPRAVPGTDFVRFQDWLAALLPFFDGVAPHVSAVSVPTADAGGKWPVTALSIETRRAPFVIRGGAMTDVPWWEPGQAKIRSAGRMELLKLLSPLQDLPQFEILEADLSFYRNPHVSSASRATFRWTLDAALYAIPRGDARAVIPLHRCRGAIAIAGTDFRSDATEFNLTSDKNSPAVRITESAALIEGLGRFFVYCCGSTRDPDLVWRNRAALHIDLSPAGSERTATASAELLPEPSTESNQAGRWKL